jgi:hypothetical protein
VALEGAGGGLERATEVRDEDHIDVAAARTECPALLAAGWRTAGCRASR